jgi:hypothetical protein
MTKEIRTKDCKLVGVHLPLPVLNYLNLYTILTGQTRAAVIRNQIVSWMEANKTAYPEKLILEKLRIQSKADFDSKSMNPDFNREKYISEVKKVMEKKGLTPDQIKYILS